MKKQGSLFLKIVFGVIGITLVLMLVLQQLVPQAKVTKTETAVFYEVGDGISTSGFVVRSEQLVQKQGVVCVPARNEGEWVGCGQALASTYRDETAQQQQAHADTLRAELDRLQVAYDHCTTSSDSALLERDIRLELSNLSVSLARRDLPAVRSCTEELKTVVLRRYTDETDADALLSRIQAIKDELSAIPLLTTQSSLSLPAPTSGYFSTNIDGLEAELTPDLLETLDCAEVARICALEPTAPENSFGKLIESDLWYYVTVVDAESMEEYRTGKHLTVRFSYDIDESLSMEIVFIGANEDGKCVLALRADSYVFRTTAQRQQSAQIVFRSLSGLRVPKDALYFRDGKPGVYVLEGACAAWKSVELIWDNQDAYLVKLDKSDTDNLWPGDEIIVTNDEIYPGKVVAP